MTAKLAAPTEESVCRALYRHFIEQTWAPVVHVAADPAHAAEEDRAAGRSPRIIDMLLVRTPRKKQLGPIELLAIEVKVTRADFLNDARTPAKQQAWRTIAHRHAYAAPAGLIRPEEVPAGSGLIEVGEAKTGALFNAPRGTGPAVRWAVRAPYTPTPDVPASLLLTFAWRAARAEGRARGFSWDTRDDLDDPEAMRAELHRLAREQEKTFNALERTRQERDAWRIAYAAAGHGVPCGTCTHPLIPVIRSGALSHWRHQAPAHNDPCAQARQAAAEADARARWETRSEEQQAFDIELHGPEAWRHMMWGGRHPEPADTEEGTG